jgi:hypothetical protein
MGGRLEYCLGAVELLGDDSSIPTQDGIGLGCARNLAECFASNPLSDFTERDSLRVRKLQSPQSFA